MEEVPEIFLEFHSKLLHKIFVIILGDIITSYEISVCFSVNHDSELRCVICTGVTLFVLMLHLNCTALSQSEQSNFFMYIIHTKTTIHLSVGG